MKAIDGPQELESSAHEEVLISNPCAKTEIIGFFYEASGERDDW